MIENRCYRDELSDSTIDEMAHLFSACFGQPPDRDLAVRIRQKPRVMVPIVYEDGQPIGYKLGYERQRDTFYSWLGGVHPDFRRRGIARELPPTATSGLQG